MCPLPLPQAAVAGTLQQLGGAVGRQVGNAVPALPPCRYKIMREYMPKRGDLGRDMMFRSCTVQVRRRSCELAGVVGMHAS